MIRCAKGYWLRANNDMTAAIENLIWYERNQSKVVVLVEELLAYETRFNWKNDLSIHALSDLIRDAAKFDFIFIDGNHRFDDVIVDFYLSDHILKPGGLITFDDMWMPSIQAAVSFVLNNRDYELVPQSVWNMTVIKKKRNDVRDWRHYIDFRAERPLYKKIVGCLLMDFKS
jgi:predicted O-methyltransferase YrrM